MTAPSRPAFCGCKVINGKIVFCALHERAENLLAVVEHLQAFLSNVKIADESDAIRLREVILPYVVDALRRAKKDIPPMK